MKIGFRGSVGQEYVFDNTSELAEYLVEIITIRKDIHTKEDLLSLIEQHVYNIED